MRRRDERGFAAAEWVAAVGLLLIPCYVVIMTAVRIPEARSDAQIIATEAARAGAQSGSCAAAHTEAVKTAATLTTELSVRGDPSVETAGNFEPDGGFEVTYTRRAPLAYLPGLEGFSIPGVEISESHREPIDRYRFFTATGSCSKLTTRVPS
jgi:Flp pilus assembly protein TadG